MEFLETKLDSKKVGINDIGILNLAYLGDSIWELTVRNYFLLKELDLNKLNVKVKNYVNAKKQSEIYVKLMATMDEDELSFSKRARNVKIKTSRKSCDIVEYKNASAFEALIAYHFINKNEEKIKKIIKYIDEGEQNEI